MERVQYAEIFESAPDEENIILIVFGQENYANLRHASTVPEVIFSVKLSDIAQ